MGKKLTDLTERTATANTDLIHVNSGGTDYKQSKEKFLHGQFTKEFGSSSTLTSQADALPADATYFGYLWNYQHTSATACPINNLCYITVKKPNSDLYTSIDAISVTDLNEHYVIKKVNGSWDSSWTQLPGPSAVTDLDNNVLRRWPSNIASYSEFDALATRGGFYTFRVSAGFSIGGLSLPSYGRGLIMNYSSTDSSFIYVSPDGLWYGFKNSGTWHVKRASTF